MITREAVMAKFGRDDKFAVNLLLALYERQTTDEQQAQATGHDNGVGFNGTDAGILSSFAEQAKQNRVSRQYASDLSPKQMVLLRKKLAKYGRQLTDLTNEAMAARETTPRQFGNDEGVLAAAEYAASQEDRSPYGELPATKHHPLPAHLQRNQTVEVSFDANSEVIQTDAPFLFGEGPGALVPCPGGFRFKTAREQWTEGGKREFNAQVVRWCEERQTSGELVTVGGGPSNGGSDPFDL